jgi:hypothetical protein
VFAAAIAAATQTRLDHVASFLREILPGIVPKVVLRGGGGSAFDIEFGSRRSNVDAVLENIFDLPEQIARRRNKRVVVALDEFQEIASFDGDALQKSLRSRIQHHRRVTYCFLGSKREMIAGLFLEQKSPFYRFGKLRELRKIPRDKMADFIATCFASTGLSIPKEVVEGILDAAENHPYFTQMLCHEVWNRSALRGKVQPADLEEAARGVIDNQSYAYVNLWESLTSKQKNLLGVIGLGDRPRLHSQEVVTRYELGSPAAVSKNLRTLEVRQILEPVDGEHRFADPFLRRWVLNQ